jgi:hypothetical protein
MEPFSGRQGQMVSSAIRLSFIEDSQRFIPLTALILTNSAPVDPLEAMFIYRQKRFPVKYNHDPPTSCLSSSSSLPTHLIDALPSLATDDFLPQGDLAIRTSDGQDVPSETPRDPPYGIGEERVRVVRPVREELGRRPGRSGGRAEVDLDGSVLRRVGESEPSISNRLR